MAVGLAEARADCAVGKVSACGVCLGKVLCLPQREPRGWCKQSIGLGRHQGSWPLWEGSGVGEGRNSPVPSHICCPRTLLSGWKRCWLWMLLLLAAPEKLCCWLFVAAKSQIGGAVRVH